MAEQRDTLSVIAAQLSLGLVPLRRALADDESFSAFMLRFGWQMDAIPPELAQLAGVVERAIEAGAGMRLDGDANAALAVLAAVREVHDVVAGLKQAPPGIDVAVFLQEFSERLFELLIVDQISAANPGLRATLRLLGIVTETWVPEAGARPAHLSIRLRLDTLRELIARPRDVPGRVLRWATLEFDFLDFAGRVIGLIQGLGLTARLERVEPARAAAFQAGAPPGTRPLSWMVRVSLVERMLLGVPIVVGVAIYELPAEGTKPPGLVFEPLFPDDLSGEMALARDVTLRLRAGTTLAERFGVLLRAGEIDVRYPDAPGTATPAEGVGASLVYTPAEARVWLGHPSRSRLQIRGFQLSADLDLHGGDGVVHIAAATEGFEVVLAPGDLDGFVSQLVGDHERSLRVPMRVAWSSKDGLSFAGGADFSVSLSPQLALGPITLRDLVARLGAPASGPPALELSLTLTLTGALGPMALTVGGIGLRLALTQRAGNAGPLQVDTGFQAPTEIGIVIDSGSVSGGGFLRLDPKNAQYAGALQLALGQRWTLSAIGLLTTRLPDGSDGFSLLVVGSIEFDPPYPLFLGITLQGIGLLVGIHRAMDPEALRAGVRNKTLDALLFPQDVVANAAHYVDSLKAVFPPARGHHLLGLTVSLGFATPPVVRAELGVVYEFGAGRWAVMGQLHAEFPPTVKGAQVTQKILEMHIDAVGILDLGRGEFSLDATLYDSRIAFVSFSGDVSVRVRKGDSSFFLVSAGGYHPKFAVPPGFPRLQRLTISLADSDNLRLLLTGYVAVTSNTRQIGARMEFFAGFAGFSIESTLSFDALWEVDVRFVVEFDDEFTLKYKGHTFYGVDVSGSFTGPHPKRVVGKWSIDLWLFSISKSFHLTLGSDRPPVALPSVDPLPALVAALKEPGNWHADLPDGAHTMVSLRKRLDAAQVIVHPLGRLGVRQQVVPLSIRIDRFAGAPVAGAPSLQITGATVGGSPVDASGLVAVDEQFAAADFIAMSDQERLARPSFEAMPAGVRISAVDRVVFGDHTAVSDMDYDERIVSADGAARVPAQSGSVGGPLAIMAAAFGPAARSPLRTTGTDRFAMASTGLRVGPESFVVARVDDLAQTQITGAASFTAAKQALDGHLAEDPNARGDLQVVPAFNAGAAV
ncbi:MAG TPA: DUF6603 domain-containing protein [Solirubrobacteraceae bacterium]|jgi:hypothetical protein|nr:DUF6603 domain-containing protein [Solirubrobacteraceae bacterium]